MWTPMAKRSHFHANMFNLAMVDDIDDDSSLHRMARAKELMPARTIRRLCTFWETCRSKRMR